MAGDPMGSIDLYQSAGLCAQPEATQDNPQNLSTARTTVLFYVYQTLFPHPHTKEKSSLATRDYQHTPLLEALKPAPSIPHYKTQVNTIKSIWKNRNVLGRIITVPLKRNVASVHK